MVRQDRSIATVRLASLGAALTMLSALFVAALILAGQSTRIAAASSSHRPSSASLNDTPTDGGASPTPTPSCELYSYTLDDGTPIGGIYDIGNHCDFCGTTITLPFSVSMYGENFITAKVTSKGLVAFGFAHTAFTVECLPFSGSTYAMAPFWVDQWTATSICPLCGIFTNTVGTAPNRTFIVEWRTIYYGQRDLPPTLNYEIQLQEGQSTFKYVYKLVTSFDTDTALTIGTQLSRTSDIYTRYYCDPEGAIAPPLSGKQLTWVCDPCLTPTVGPTSTATPFTPGPTNTSAGCFDNGSVPVTCTPTPIATTTGGPPSHTPTNTSASPSPTSCTSQNYSASSTPGPIEPGDTFVPGSNCDDCSVDIPLPFSYSLYDQPYATVRVYANGIATFGNSPARVTSCLPVSGASYTIFAHGDDLLLTSSGDGIYTSTTGTAPNRIFTIEWRGCYYNGGICGADVNFALRLDEGLRRFELRYGTTPQTVALVGVQRDAASYTQYQCGGSISGSVIFTLDSCATPTPGTPTSTPTLAQSPTPGGPDLVAGFHFTGPGPPPGCDRSYSPRRPLWGPFTLTTYNIGIMGVPVTTTMRFEHESGAAADFAVPPFSGTSYSLQVSCGSGVPCPSYKPSVYTLTVDYNNVIVEPNEANNVLSEAVAKTIYPTRTPCPPSPSPTSTVPTPTITSTTSTPTITSTPTACAIHFTDVPTNHTFYDSIWCLVCHDVVSGYTSGCETGDPCFRPGNMGIGSPTRTIRRVTCARSTRGPESSSGSSTPSRSAASSATTPGTADPGSSPATPTCGRR